MRRRIVVLGAGFSGLVAAVELKRHLGDRHDVVVVAPEDEFVFQPSLIWVPFGLRTRAELTFPLAEALGHRRIPFRRAPAQAIDLSRHEVFLPEQTLSFDFLVLATGSTPWYEGVPGLGPHTGHTSSLLSLDEAQAAAEDFDRLVDRPGPAVVGLAPGGCCFLVACELVLNLAHQLEKRGLRERVPVTYVTPEPYLGHLGMGGFGRLGPAIEQLFERAGVQVVADAAVTRVEPDALHLDDGRTLPFRFATIFPAVRGVPAVARLEAITSPTGFVRTDSTYRTPEHPEVFACGAAIHIDPPDATRVPCGVPRTGYLCEEMARVAAWNVGAVIEGRRPVALPPASIDAKCVLDAGGTGFILTSDHFLEPREHAWIIPGPEAHWAKLAYEKFFLATRKRGLL